MTKWAFLVCLCSPSLSMPLWQGRDYSFRLAGGQLGHRAADGAACGHAKPAEKPG